MYLFHRITGVALFGYLLLHIISTALILAGPEIYEGAEAIYKNFYFQDAINAFKLGVRSPDNKDFIHLNVPTYMRWLRKHKDLIWDARSKFDAGADPKTLPHYSPEPKLLT